LLVFSGALASGCATFLVPSPCDELACSPFACSDNGYCLEECIVDEECGDGFVCDYVANDCIPVCDDDDCDGYACEELLNECKTHCFGDDDCASGHHCCDLGDACADTSLAECRPDRG
jgi:hypothetical protein